MALAQNPRTLYTLSSMACLAQLESQQPCWQGILEAAFTSCPALRGLRRIMQRAHVQKTKQHNMHQASMHTEWVPRRRRQLGNNSNRGGPGALGWWAQGPALRWGRVLAAWHRPPVTLAARHTGTNNSPDTAAGTRARVHPRASDPSSAAIPGRQGGQQVWGLQCPPHTTLTLMCPTTHTHTHAVMWSVGGCTRVRAS